MQKLFVDELEKYSKIPLFNLLLTSCDKWIDKEFDPAFATKIIYENIINKSADLSNFIVMDKNKIKIKYLEVKTSNGEWCITIVKNYYIESDYKYSYYSRNQGLANMFNSFLINGEINSISITSEEFLEELGKYYGEKFGYSYKISYGY